MAAALSAVAAQLRNSHLPETPSCFRSLPPPFPLFQHTLQELLSFLPNGYTCYCLLLQFCMYPVCCVISSSSIKQLGGAERKCKIFFYISLQRLYLEVDYVLAFF